MLVKYMGSLIISAKDVIFSPCFRVRWLVGLLGCQQNYTKKLLYRFPQNLDGGWVSAQNRPH